MGWYHRYKVEIFPFRLINLQKLSFNDAQQDIFAIEVYIHRYIHRVYQLYLWMIYIWYMIYIWGVPKGWDYIDDLKFLYISWSINAELSCLSRRKSFNGLNIFFTKKRNQFTARNHKNYKNSEHSSLKSHRLWVILCVPQAVNKGNDWGGGEYVLRRALSLICSACTPSLGEEICTLYTL